MEHKCHALNCPLEVPPKMLMCLRHWRMVPKSLQDRVWATYRRGQEVTKTPSMSYLKAAKDAIRAVAEKEGRLDRLGFEPISEDDIPF